jgi:hypothetical protein
MQIIGVKLNETADADSLVKFIDEWAVELVIPTRRGSLRSLTLYRSNKTDFRQNEFVLTIEGFVEDPSLDELEKLCKIVYNFDCEPLDTWPKDAGREILGNPGGDQAQTIQIWTRAGWGRSCDKDRPFQRFSTPRL